MYKEKKILAITLARGGSKSIPKKNIALIDGKPLIAYTFEAAKACKYIDDYIVSTDDDSISDVAKSYAVEVPFKRPSDISSDTASSAAALIHAVNFMESKNNVKYDVIVELMATNPMKTPEQIGQSIEMLVDKQADSVIAVVQVFDQHPARIKKIVDGKLEDFCIHEPREARRQDLTPAAYLRCGSIYTLDRDYLMTTKNRYGSANSYPIIVPEDQSVNIDSVLDFHIAEILLQQRRKSENIL